MQTWSEKDGIVRIHYIFEEGGWYIETDYFSNCVLLGYIRLYEVPRYGGDRRLMGEFASLSSAYKAAKELT